MNKSTAAADAGTITKRRITWEALWKLRRDLRPANDNAKREDKAA